MSSTHNERTLSMTGYTQRMKTAISVPDEVFDSAERLADRLGWSRSHLYTQAVREFLERQGDDPVTAALDALADEANEGAPPSAGRLLVEGGAWEW